MDEKKVSALWKKFQKAFLAAAQSLGGPDRFQIFTRSVDFQSHEWRATIGESSTEVSEVTRELKKAGAILVELATALSLVLDAKAIVAEAVCPILSTHYVIIRFNKVNSALSIYSLPTTPTNYI